MRTAILACLMLLLIGSASGQDGGLPLLQPSQAVGLVYSEVDPLARPSTDAAWGTALAFGVDAYQLAVPWDEMATADGTPQIGPVIDLLDQFHAAGLQTFLTIQTVDTTNLRLPADLLDPTEPRRLRPGLAFDSPEVIGPLIDLLVQLAPELAQRGVFFVSLGNEVDTWLASNPDQAFPLAVFAEFGRQTIRGIDPRMRAGITMTRDVLDQPELAALLVSVCDALPVTYYPIEVEVVLSPEAIVADFDAFEQLAGDKPVLIQEFGCPSGPADGSGVLGASPELQCRWIEAGFRELRARPNIRFLSVLHLADWPPEVIATFEGYYGSSDPAFVEFLSTLGLMDGSGSAKPAYVEFLRQLVLTNQIRTLHKRGVPNPIGPG